MSAITVKELLNRVRTTLAPDACASVETLLRQILDMTTLYMNSEVQEVYRRDNWRNINPLNRDYGDSPLRKLAVTRSAKGWDDEDRTLDDLITAIYMVAIHPAIDSGCTTDVQQWAIYDALRELVTQYAITTCLNANFGQCEIESVQLGTRWSCAG